MTWIVGLSRYENQDVTEGGILTAVTFQAARLFRDRLSAGGDMDVFDRLLAGVFRKDWPTMVVNTGKNVIDIPVGFLVQFDLFLFFIA